MFISLLKVFYVPSIMYRKSKKKNKYLAAQSEYFHILYLSFYILNLDKLFAINLHVNIIVDIYNFYIKWEYTYRNHVFVILL